MVALDESVAFSAGEPTAKFPSATSPVLVVSVPAGGVDPVVPSSSNDLPKKNDQTLLNSHHNNHPLFEIRSNAQALRPQPHFSFTSSLVKGVFPL